MLSPLAHTWILDLDGTLVKHNGYKADGRDTLLDGAKEFMDSIPPCDMVIFVTSRKEHECGSETEDFLRKNGIRYDRIIWDAPYGERILVNDDKPSGLAMAYAVRKARDGGEFPQFTVDENL